jgi:hypothetical protein
VWEQGLDLMRLIKSAAGPRPGLWLLGCVCGRAADGHREGGGGEGESSGLDEQV